jgi:hypothetical protein
VSCGAARDHGIAELVKRRDEILALPAEWALSTNIRNRVCACIIPTDHSAGGLTPSGQWIFDE